MEKLHPSANASRNFAGVAAGQEHEVRYEAQETEKTLADIKGAVKGVGNSRAKVEDRLSKR